MKNIISRRKILLLPRYDRAGASSRYRLYQYLPALIKAGFDVNTSPLLKNNYIDHLYKKKPLPLLSIVRGYLKRLFLLLTSNKYDIIWLQQEALPWIPGGLEKILLNSKFKVITDHDDAFFHRYDMHKIGIIRKLLGHKIDTVMSCASLVLAGNDYLAERAKKNNKQVKIFPTVVDTEVYKKMDEGNSQYFNIGWIGSPGTSKYLKLIEPALRQIYNKGGVKITLIGAGEIELKGFNYEIAEWSEEKEVVEISKFDVGIMPLPNNPWEKGKCGFKIIQYLACEVPVIASPVGVNKQIIEHGVNGFIANSTDEWYTYFNKLKNNSALRKTMGKNGRLLIESKYSLKNNANVLITYINQLIHENKY